MSRAEIRSKFDEIVAFAEVEQFLDTPVKRYSSGMYVRLAFAVAAHLDSEILIVDEVLAVGDFSFQTKCLEKMQNISGSGRTVLFVSHNLGAIERLCSRCILLNRGKVLIDDQTNRVIEQYISQGLQDRPEYVQTHNSEKPINLRKVCLISTDGQLATEFRYDQEQQVFIEYEVNQMITDTSVWIGIPYG
ncbi:MAG: hypothetical protein R3E79_31960 [Caldilineaceae bacterium]